MNNQDNRKLLSVLCHGSILPITTRFSILIPIAILLTCEDPIVKKNAKEVLNFYITILIYLLIYSAVTYSLSILLSLLGNSFLIEFIPTVIISLIHITYLFTPLNIVVFAIVRAIVYFAMPIIAIINVISKPNQSYRYPLIFHFFS